MHRQLPVPLLCVLPLLLPTVAGAAVLESLTITPDSAVVTDGATQLFTANGVFENGTEGRLSNATLAAGGNHSCAILRGGGVRCWGQDNAGQLGDGAGATVATVPRPVVGIDTATSVATGFEHSCAVLAGGTVRCWGRGTEGELGNGGSSNAFVPVVVSSLPAVPAIAVGAGFQHSCALLADGTIRCWGANGEGQLGDTTTSPSVLPVQVSGITTAVGLSVGGNNSCAVLASGEVRCWGANNAGQLGNGGGGGSSVPVPVSGISTGTTVAVGFDYACALLSDGPIKCWGRGLEGQLGDGNQSSSDLPVQAALIVGQPVALSVSTGHSCALMAGGTMQCWGSNGNGQLGNGTVVGTFPDPALVTGITSAIAIANGYQHTCALLANGAIKCWGINYQSQLGNGTTFARTGSPVSVNGTARFVDTGGNHSCVIGPSRTITCWGDDFYGQLGQGTGSSTQPVVVQGINTAVDIALGFDHTCAILVDGSGRCWGRNDLGQLGINSTMPAATATPHSVPLLSNAVAIAAGAYHTCAVIADGTVQCWGENNVGQLAYSLGTGVIVTFPSTIVGLNSVTAITAGFEHTCALLSTGRVACWGRGDEGELGNNGTSNSNSPVLVSGISNATAISAGNYHTCARLATSDIKCWGRGDEGQLGNNGTADALTPVDTLNDANAVEITSGGYHSCFRTLFNSLRCWGRGDLGQLGTSNFSGALTPQLVNIISTVTAVDAGRSHTCAVLQDGTVQCWGYDEFGQLGDGGTTNSALPKVANGLSMEGVALAWSSGYPEVSIDMSGHAQVSGLGQFYVGAGYDRAGNYASLLAAADTDADGVPDPVDNCTLVPNANQRDTNGDGYGNICDPDFNNNGIVDSQDGALLKAAFGSAAFQDRDLNGNGIVDSQDGAILKARFGQAPGPSGLHP